MIPTTLDQIQQLAQRVVEAEGLDLVEVEFKTGKSRKLLRVFIDKPGGVTVSDCENISQQLGTLLDVENLLQDAYILEVSSPGVDRPLKSDRDFQRALGHWVKVYVNGPDHQGTPISGKLSQVDGKEIVIDQKGELLVIGREQIQRAQQEIPLPVHPQRKKKKRK